MTELEVLRLLGEVRSLDSRIGIRDEQEARAKAAAWWPYLRNAHLEDALYAVRNYYRVHRAEVIQIGDVQGGAVRALNESAVGGGSRPELERLCPWSRYCACTHTDCTNGLLDEALPALTLAGRPSVAAVSRCPQCSAARDMVAEENGDTRPRRRR